MAIRTSADEVDDEPGLLEVDTVAHCGPTMKGEFARSVNSRRYAYRVGVHHRDPQ